MHCVSPQIEIVEMPSEPESSAEEEAVAYLMNLRFQHDQQRVLQCFIESY